ncbi:hypothetical protein CJ201_04765 [Corynebacterium aurimucosum]|nr:hypothetical protein CJ201_04765 [Corynebacterium aurimucosum]
MRKFAAGDCLDGGGDIGWKWYGGVDGFATNDELEAAVFLEYSHQAFDGLTTSGLHQVGHG